jgi:hypothetical protein
MRRSRLTSPRRRPSAAVKELVRIGLMISLLCVIQAARDGTQPVRDGRRDDSPIDLAGLLADAASYCDRLNASVLDFVCRERINERFYFNFNQGKFFASSLVETDAENDYLYDYQLVRRNRKIRETRKLLEANGRTYKSPESPLLTRRFAHERVIFGPVGMLGSSWQPCFDFRPVGRKSWRGMDAVVIDAIPRKGAKVPHLYGRIWLKTDDASVLRIEWAPRSLGGHTDLLRLAKRFRARLTITFSSEYANTIGGLRFPSSYSIEERYILHPGQAIQVLTTGSTHWIKEFLLSETVVQYYDYKFFTVETEVEIKNR